MAVQERVITVNPMDSFKKLKTAETEKRVLSADEIRIIFGMPFGFDRMVIIIGLLTGLRLMDVISLKWSDIDYNNSTLSTIQRKTGRRVSIPLPVFLVNELIEFKKLSDNNGDSALSG